ncbi:universal stress protein [Halocatena salina]|uniref:Universal stress protein n=1 Tax=Halocatena salina TaxID=2934340 RepID=A0A8U0A7L7_9EURY|nr:universal stress protein [Halocatena salina]UPM44839.1 universal stress protein [Halocatena salina]
MYDTILIPCDGSEASTAALDHGLAIADTHDATVHLLHVVNVGTEIAATGMAVGEVMDTLTDAGQEILSEAATRAEDAGIAYEQELLEGIPYEAIGEYATDRPIDLTVMGTTGRSGVTERLLGSTTDRVLRRTDTPILIAPDADAASTDSGSYAHVLAPTDGSNNAERAAPYGADIAQHANATLHIVSVVDVQAEGGVFSIGGVSEEFIDQLEEQGHEAVSHFADRVSETDADVDLSKTVTQGTPHEALREYVADNGIDIVVIASQGTSNLASQHLGSVADQVLRTVDKPILVVPPAD